MVRWPAYVRLQRQKKILNMRLKVPPSLAQFQHVLDRNSEWNEMVRRAQ
jgi:large subunit ribosomal protein L7Ae